MRFEWDSKKNEQNLEKHGIDFQDAAQILLEPHFLRRSDRGGEKRWMAVGPLEGRLITMVYTKRGHDVYRIISARRARENEREQYHTEIG